jgi:hypothetical protein
MSEKDVQKAIKDVAALHGYMISDLSQPRASMQTLGLPDLYLQNPRRKLRLWVEVKREKGKLSEAQMRWHEAETAAGGMVAVLRSGHEAHLFFTDLHRACDSGDGPG